MSIIFSVGRWGGIYISRALGLRICLGWVTFTVMPVDFDDLLKLATEGTRQPELVVCIQGVGDDGQPGQFTLNQKNGELEKNQI